MDELDYWRLCEAFLLPEAAALIIGEAPSSVSFNGNAHYLTDYRDEAPDKEAYFQAALSSLLAALKRGTLKGDEPPRFVDGAYNLQTVRIAAEDLRAWLESRGITTGFFFPIREEGQPGYLDRTHPNYPPKLAAAIRAWEAVTNDPDRVRGKTPKQALTKWLNEHAAVYGLTKDDGTPNATGVEEAAKLANWKPEGGASKTPGE